jgi:hypothetical protein
MQPVSVDEVGGLVPVSITVILASGIASVPAEASPASTEKLTATPARTSKIPFICSDSLADN